MAAILSAAVAVLAVLAGCGLIGDERAADGPAELATSTVPSASDEAGRPGAGGDPAQPPATVADPGPLTDEQLQFDPANFPPLFEPQLELPPEYPRSPEFCAAGVRLAQFAEQLFASGEQDPVAVDGLLRAFFYQFGRTMALAPPEIADQAAVAKRAVYDNAARLNGLGTIEEFRVAIRDLVTATPELEPAVNGMIAWCGDTKDISILPRF